MTWTLGTSLCQLKSFQVVSLQEVTKVLKGILGRDEESVDIRC